MWTFSRQRSETCRRRERRVRVRSSRPTFLTKCQKCFTSREFHLPPFTLVELGLGSDLNLFYFYSATFFNNFSYASSGTVKHTRNKCFGLFCFNVNGRTFKIGFISYLFTRLIIRKNVDERVLLFPLRHTN